jgi:uncharacterized protein
MHPKRDFGAESNRGAVPKWLREGSAKPLSSGSNPFGASNTTRAYRENNLRCLIVPGLNGSGPDHWQTLWERQYHFERVEQRHWGNPDVVAWTETLDAAICAHSEKVVLIAHSLGCWTVIHWAALHADKKDKVQSALLVAPPDIALSDILPKSVIDFAPPRQNKLPFPSILAGSENDPYMTLKRAQELASTTGSHFVNTGLVGHINIDSGHGPWPQGESLLKNMMHGLESHF